MRQTITHRELRNNSSAVLREVQSGQAFEITNHGHVVARLVPVASAPAPPATVQATRIGGFSGLPRARIDETAQDVLDDLRGQ